MPFVLSFSGRQHECGECKCRSSRWLADGQDSQRGQSWFASECSSLPSQNMGRVVSSDEIRHATGTSEWARRLRELRDEFGYAILTCADETRAKSRGISKASLFKHPIIERLLLQIQRVRLLERVPVWQTRVSATSRLCQLLCPPNRQMGTGAHSQPHARITTKLFCLSGNVENRRVVLTIPPALGAGGLPVQVRAPRPIFSLVYGHLAKPFPSLLENSMGTYCILAVPTAAAPLLGSAVRDSFLAVLSLSLCSAPRFYVSHRHPCSSHWSFSALLF